jgi:hypothetical protein
VQLTVNIGWRQLIFSNVTTKPVQPTNNLVQPGATHSQHWLASAYIQQCYEQAGATSK